MRAVKFTLTVACAVVPVPGLNDQRVRPLEGKEEKKKKKIKVRMNLNKIASLAFMCPTRGITSSLISNTVS